MTTHRGRAADARIVEARSEDKPSSDGLHTGSRGRLRAIFEWLGRLPLSPQSASPVLEAPVRAQVPARVGHYVVVRRLGEGGMGVVYAARDERLERPVALKMISAPMDSEAARKRFWREARAAASVNHPNICQIYEIGEDEGQLFIAMELLEGQTLAERLARGPMRVSEAVTVGLAILSALSALHARGVIHRDLKPSNVFLTSHGVKLLDFGLARFDLESLGGADAVTMTGIVAGTPRYMSPEQVTGEAVDGRCDLFAAGAILFEMLAGRPAFDGRTSVEVVHATLYEQPPALTGSSDVAAVDRVIRRALAKRPAERPASADEMAQELRAVGIVDSGDAPTLARALTRLVVMPFRVLRPDPETDFLAFSLPDAIANSLSGTSSLIVRSSATAARFVGETPDLKALAAEADVDRVVMGTVLRSGDELRVAAQLVETPGGRLLTSYTVDSSLGDLFRLQDDIARRVADALSLPLTGERSAARGDTPADPRAYELYLRANELARSFDGLLQARELYERCLQLDPGFAPAWAHLGRCHRVIGKFVESTPDSEKRAEEAFRRALEHNPRLSVAHKLYANLEADMGLTKQALVRLLDEANRHRNDPELYAGLVHACRYCGLYDESIAAHAEARRLDPNVPTSLGQTLLLTGDVEPLLAADPFAGGGDDPSRIIALGFAGRRDEARQVLTEMRQKANIPLFQTYAERLMAWLERRPDELAAVVPPELSALKIREDPEAIFREGWLLCDVGAHEAGLAELRRAIAKGYFAAPALSRNPQFDPIRSLPAFQGILAAAEAGRQEALAAFREHGGERLLGRCCA